MLLLIDEHLHVVHARPSALPQLSLGAGYTGRGCCKPGAALQEPELVGVPGICRAACIMNQLVGVLGSHRTGELL